MRQDVRPGSNLAGVSFDKNRQKWVVQKMHDRKTIAYVTPSNLSLSKHTNTHAHTVTEERHATLKDAKAAAERVHKSSQKSLRRGDRSHRDKFCAWETIYSVPGRPSVWDLV